VFFLYYEPLLGDSFSRIQKSAKFKNENSKNASFMQI
jgi:hypothetical protein